MSNLLFNDDWCWHPPAWDTYGPGTWLHNGKCAVSLDETLRNPGWTVYDVAHNELTRRWAIVARHARKNDPWSHVGEAGQIDLYHPRRGHDGTDHSTVRIFTLAALDRQPPTAKGVGNWYRCSDGKTRPYASTTFWVDLRHVDLLDGPPASAASTEVSTILPDCA